MSRSQYVICNGAKSKVKFVETRVQVLHIPNPLMFIHALSQIFQNAETHMVQVKVVCWLIFWFN